MRKYTSDESGSTALGQGGSVFIDTADQDITAPTGSVFVAVTIISDAKFNDLIQEDNTQFMGTAGSAATDGPPGYIITNSDEFPAGITIYGRWTTIDIDAGSVVAYLG